MIELVDLALFPLVPVVGGIVGGLVKRTAGKVIKNEAKRIVARGGALSGPVRNVGGAIARAGGGGFLGTSGRKIAGALAGGAAAGAGVEIVSNLMNGRTKKKYRRMRVTNTKALNRALRRVEGFTKIVKKSFIVSGEIKARKSGRGR